MVPQQKLFHFFYSHLVLVAAAHVRNNETELTITAGLS